MNTSLPRAGFVAILGEPNVGKSTLLNVMLGTKLSIVSSKPQTTRKRILGIFTDEKSVPPRQIVFFDTPGVLTPRYSLHKSMMENVRSSIDGADVLLVVLDAPMFVSPRHKRQTLYGVAKKLQTTFEAIGKPVVVALNKMDAIHDKKQVLPVMEELLQTGVVQNVVALSALQNKYVDDLVDVIGTLLPEHEFYYDPELLSEQPQRFFVAELIREVIFVAYRDEIPYATEVVITEFKEREAGKWYIAADIVIERDTQKGIIIGKNGEKLKQTGQTARLAIEEYLGLPVYLELYVKVRQDWRNNQTYLRSFGY